MIEQSTLPTPPDQLRSMEPDEFARQLAVFARDHPGEFLELVRTAERAAPEVFKRLRRKAARIDGTWTPP